MSYTFQSHYGQSTIRLTESSITRLGEYIIWCFYHFWQKFPPILKRSQLIFEKFQFFNDSIFLSNLMLVNVERLEETNCFVK